MKYPVLLCATEIAALWGGEGTSAEHTLSPRGLKQRIAICFLILSFQNLGVMCLGGRCILVGGRLLCSTWLNEELWMFYEEEAKNSQGIWFPVNTKLLIPSEIHGQWGLKGQPFLTQEMVTMSFENEWKKYVFGCVPNGFLVFIVAVFCCPCLDWVALYFASVLDFSGSSRGIRWCLHWQQSVLPFATIKCFAV